MQRSRRANPYPFTWEIPGALSVVAFLLLLLGVHLGRSLANALSGNGWLFVDRAQLFSSLGGIFAGNADAGLAGVQHPAGPGLLWSCIGILELAVLVACTVALKVGLDRWGPGRLQGMATPSEAEELLGLSRLRKHAKVIRPDLYGAIKRGVR